ncbi:MAG TPA: nitroreductase family protein, partial [Bacillota bacterium]|nr:nitroreductase family protein [Bacillota bacterium]
MGLSEGNYRSSVLFKRRSIRKFKSGKPAEWQVRALLEAAMCTPTACNGMPFELILIEDREVLDKLQKVLPFSRLRTAPMAMAVISHKDWKSKLTPCGLFIQQDLAAVSLQICLAACEVGLGACWCGVHPV